MISHEQRIALLEFLFRKPGVTLQDVPDTPETFEHLIQDMFDDLQRSNSQLREQVALPGSAKPGAQRIRPHGCP